MAEDNEGRRDNPGSGGDAADADYGFSGRAGFEEGSYSSAYGRGSAGERDAPSASGAGGAGYSRGGTEIPAPDVEGGEPVRADDGGDDAASGGTGRTGR